MLKSFNFVWIFFGIVFVTLGQSPRFILRTDRTQIPEGETFMLEAILENIDSKSIKLPDVSPFKIVQGPSTSTSISIVNGKSSGSYSQKYLLLAPKVGKFKLPPATAQVGGRTIRTNDIVIDVVKQQRAALLDKSAVNGETFFRIEPSTKNAYIGQQVVLNYVIYTRQNLSSYNIVDEPKPEGFFAEPLNNVQDPAQKKLVNGLEYYSQVVRRLILYPQKTGNFNIGPIRFSVEIPVNNGNSSFFFVDTERKFLNSNSIKLTVADLPKSTLPSFCGGVGTFDMQATINKTTVKVGEAINVVMTVSGDGDSRLVKAPEWPYPSGLQKYEPSTTQDESVGLGDKKKITKVFEYIFVPSKDSIYTLKPELSYFSPESGKYEVITAGPFTVNVVKSNTPSINNVNTNTGAQIDELRSSDTDLWLNKSPWLSYWHLGSICLVIFSTILALVLKRKKIQEAKEGNILHAKASYIALKNLQEANKFMAEQNPALFYDEISKATTGYILKKYNISNSESSILDIVKILEKETVSSDLIEKYTQIQKKCEVAKFAGIYHTNMEEMYQDALSLINKMEEK